MQAIKFILVESEQDYNNEVELSNGTSLVVNTTIESVANINREARVLAAPANTILEKGDKVIIHHNIMRKSNDVTGREIKSEYHLGEPHDGVYMVPPTEIFAYKRGEGSWEALDPYVFITPIKKEIEKTTSGIYLESGAHTKYEEHVGHIKYINRELREWGLEIGDKIMFSKDSEYEFEIDGELMYRMRTSDIMGKIE